MITRITKRMKQLACIGCLGMISMNTFAQLSLQAGWAIIATPFDEQGYGMDFDQGGYGTYICGEEVNGGGTAYDAIYRGLDYGSGWNHTKTFGTGGATDKALFVKSYIAGPSEKILSIGHFSGTASYGSIAGQTLTSNFGNAVYITSNVKSTGANYWLRSIIPTTASASVSLSDFYYDAAGGFFYLTGTIENNVSFSGTIVNGGSVKEYFLQSIIPQETCNGQRQSLHLMSSFRGKPLELKEEAFALMPLAMCMYRLLWEMIIIGM
jgi:hypothetical protein